MSPKETAPSPKKPINIELLLGLSATFLSLAALVISIFQTKIARDQQHASVWPYLELLHSQFEQEYRYGLENKGIGPAIIKKVEWVYGEKTYLRPQEFFWEQIGRNTQGGKGFSAISPGAVLKPGEALELIGVTNSDTIANQLQQKLEGKLFHLRIVYSDVYGNCWQVDNEEVTELATCPD